MSQSIISKDAKIDEDVEIGQFNLIEAGAVIRKGVRLGNFCHIHGDVTIGENTIIKDYVELRKGTVIGTRCEIDSRVSCSGEAVIGDGVTVRYAAIIARGAKIGDGSYICPRVMMNNLDTEHNSIGGAHIGKNAFIGTNAVLHHGINIGDNVVVGSMSFVNNDCQSDAVYIGIPANLHKRRN